MDNRKNNGNKGHSTKSTRADDKRKSKGRQLLAQYLDKETNPEDFNKLMNKMLKLGIEGDSKAATLWLSYVAGKPDQKLEVEGGLNIPLSTWADDKENE